MWTIKAEKWEHLSTHVVEGGERNTLVEWFFEASHKDGRLLSQKVAIPAAKEVLEQVASSMTGYANKYPEVMEMEIKQGLWKEVL